MHLGIIGFGNIATTLLGLLAKSAVMPDALTILVRPETLDAAGRRLAADFPDFAGRAHVVSDAGMMLARRPGLVVECAGHSAVATHVVPILRAGTDVVQVSIGAMADAGLALALQRAAEEGGAQIVLPAGAIGGVDMLSALSAAGGLAVAYRGVKPPQAWRGTPAQDVIDLSAVTEATVFFRGTAREAAQSYPKNANVAATLALAGAGFEATQVELVADPAATGNSHSYKVSSPVANYHIEIENLSSPGNAKTSVSTIYSVLREIRNRMEWMAI